MKMTRDDIIRMAREAGFSVDGDSWVHSPNAILVDGRKSIDKQLTRFAAIIAASEREACARVAEDFLDDPYLSGHGYASGCADAIRTRLDA